MFSETQNIESIMELQNQNYNLKAVDKLATIILIMKHSKLLSLSHLYRHVTLKPIHLYLLIHSMNYYRNNLREAFMPEIPVFCHLILGSLSTVRRCSQWPRLALRLWTSQDLSVVITNSFWYQVILIIR